MSSQNSQNVVWLSLDPMRNKIDFYPANIADKIEKEQEKKETEAELEREKAEINAEFKQTYGFDNE